LKPVRLLDVMSKLFGNSTWGGSKQKKFDNAFGSAYVNYTHWVVTRDPLPEKPDRWATSWHGYCALVIRVRSGNYLKACGLVEGSFNVATVNQGWTPWQPCISVMSLLAPSLILHCFRAFSFKSS
jgi:hypothetical protein